MLETVKEYARYFDVHILSSSDPYDSYYLSKETAEELVPANVYLYQSNGWVKELLKKIIAFFVSKEVGAGENLSTELLNYKHTYLNVLSLVQSNMVLAVKAILLTVFRKIPRADYVCAYEIRGVVPALRYKKIFPHDVKLFARMQGTVLCDFIHNQHDKKYMDYVIDDKMYQKLINFDYVFMTNDGTDGDKVLNFYDIPPKKYLFLPNGIAENISKYRSQCLYSVSRREQVKVLMLSRLIGWKRVYLGIETFNILINVFKLVNYRLDIYGFGTDEEQKYLIDKIEKYSLGEFVFVNGPVPHDSVPDIIMDSDILLSLYYKTNLTNPLLEALHLNLPVLTIYDDSLNSIKSNCNGLSLELIEESDEEGMILEIAHKLKSIDVVQMRKERESKASQEPELMQWRKRIDLEVELLYQTNAGI